MSAEDSSTISRIIRNAAIIFTVLMPVAALGTRFDIWLFTTGLMLFALSMAGSLIIQIINAIWLLRKPKVATRTVLRWASLIALPPLVIVAIVLQGIAEGNPAIHNITTDVLEPPAFEQAQVQRGEGSNSLDYSPELAQTQAQAYPDLAPIISALTPSDAFDRALAICEENGWQVYLQDSQRGLIEAADTTFWFGFKDDIAIRIRSTDTGSKLDLRSVSRVGVSDMGLNAKRISAFTASFKQ